MDCLFTNKKGSSLDGFLVELVHRLTEAGFLIADLILEPRGVCFALLVNIADAHWPGQVLWRVSASWPSCSANRLSNHRCGVLVCCYAQYCRSADHRSRPFALMYFTGSDHFNRSMRLWARKNGFSLSERSLTKRLGGDLKSTPIPGIHSEEDIFTALGLKCRRFAGSFVG
jgi:hypothetical protein